MIRPRLAIALIPLLFFAACATQSKNEALWAYGLKAGESLSIETRSGGCLSTPAHYRVRLEGPEPIEARAWKIITCEHGVERERLMGSGPVHRRTISRLDAYLHTIRHPFPLLSTTGWKTVQLDWRRGTTLIQQETLQDDSLIYVLTDGWILSEVSLAKLLQEKGE